MADRKKQRVDEFRDWILSVSFLEDQARAYVGIDPGKSGGLAVVKGMAAAALPLNTMTDSEIAHMLKFLQDNLVPEREAILEKITPMPKAMRGVTPAFRIGASYGMLRGMLLAHRIRFREVMPTKWQRKLKCLTGGDKNVTKAKAQQLWPKLRITHLTADALLLAEYGRRTF